MEQQEQPPSVMTAPARAGRSWLASCLLQRQVVNVSTLEPLGRVVDVIFDPERAQVVGISVQAQTAPQGFVSAIGRALGRRNDIGLIAIEHIVALNGDVVMVDVDPKRNASAPAFEGMSRLNEVCELVILTTYGMSLGSLADLLLDYRGSGVVGYVVKPTELAESLLPPLEDLEQPEPYSAHVVDATPPAPNLPAARLRVIPATSRVRFGDSLILLVTEVEPLQRKVVVITPQAGDRTEPRSVSR